MCEKCNKIQPTFGFPGESATRCRNCKSTDMIDVKHEMCEKCDIRASKNYPGFPPRYCTQHSLPGMIDTHKRLCVFNIRPKCKESATYGDGVTLLHCYDHRQTDDIDMLNRQCIECKFLGLLNANGKCEICEPKQRLVKQNTVKDYFDLYKIEYSSYDRIYEKNCGKERPDFIFETATHLIIVECDENQHKHLTPQCEVTRMFNITQSYQRPIFWIRFNPDNYKDNKISHIAKRLEILVKSLNTAKEYNDPFMMKVQYLFYDDRDNDVVITYSEQDIITYFNENTSEQR